MNLCTCVAVAQAFVIATVASRIADEDDPIAAAQAEYDQAEADYKAEVANQIKLDSDQKARKRVQDIKLFCSQHEMDRVERRRKQDAADLLAAAQFEKERAADDARRDFDKRQAENQDAAAQEHRESMEHAKELSKKMGKNAKDEQEAAVEAHISAMYANDAIMAIKAREEAVEAVESLEAVGDLAKKTQDEQTLGLITKEGKLMSDLRDERAETAKKSVSRQSEVTEALKLAQSDTVSTLGNLALENLSICTFANGTNGTGEIGSTLMGTGAKAGLNNSLKTGEQQRQQAATTIAPTAQASNTTGGGASAAVGASNAMGGGASTTVEASITTGGASAMVPASITTGGGASTTAGVTASQAAAGPTTEAGTTAAAPSTTDTAARADAAAKDPLVAIGTDKPSEIIQQMMANQASTTGAATTAVDAITVVEAVKADNTAAVASDITATASVTTDHGVSDWFKGLAATLGFDKIKAALEGLVHQ